MNLCLKPKILNFDKLNKIGIQKVLFDLGKGEKNLVLHNSP